MSIPAHNGAGLIAYVRRYGRDEVERGAPRPASWPSVHLNA